MCGSTHITTYNKNTSLSYLSLSALNTSIYPSSIYLRNILFSYNSNCRTFFLTGKRRVNGVALRGRGSEVSH